MNYGDAQYRSISADFTIDKEDPRVLSLSATTTGISITLPPSFRGGGPAFYISNVGSNSFTVNSVTIAAGEIGVAIWAAGIWRAAVWTRVDETTNALPTRFGHAVGGSGGAGKNFQYSHLANAWSSRLNPPVNGSDQAGASVGNKIYLTAGPFYYVRKLFSYSLFPDTWTEETIQTNPDNKECAAGEGNDFVLFGRLTGGTPVMTSKVYDTVLKTWSVGSNSPAEQCLGGVSEEDPGTGNIYVYGGYEVNGAMTQLAPSIRQAYRYTVATDTWATMPTVNSSGTAVREAGSARDSRLMYMCGGMDNYPPSNPISVSNVHYSYDMSADTYATETVFPVSRAYMGGFGGCGDSKLHWAGGSDTGWYAGNPTADARSYDPALNTWDASTPDLANLLGFLDNTSCSVTPP